MADLAVGRGIRVPEDAFFQPWGILAMRGAGKTNAASVMAEELYKVGRAFVVVDPVGSWWGLRASREGKPGGLPIPIFGGDHMDVPLEEHGGAVIADFLVEEHASAVVDVSALGENAKHRFLTEFAERLFRRNRDPLVVFLEEADDYAPQRVGRGPALATLGAMQRLVKRGRFKGLTPVMVTQRSAAINKDLLTQIENLVVLRTTSPQDRKAIEGWVEYHGQSKELLESLSGLADGEAWLWSPHALGTLKRFRFRLRETFDSGATPKGGSRKVATLADVDLGALSQRMAATIEKVKESDPKELRARIAELERDLRSAQRAQPEPEIRVEYVNVIDDDMHAEVMDAMTSMETVGQQVSKTATEVLDVLRDLRKSQDAPAPQSLVPPQSRIEVATTEEITPYAAGLLEAMAKRYPMRMTRSQISMFSGRKPRSSAFQQAMADIVKVGLVERVGDQYALTESGLDAVGGEGVQAHQTSAEVRSMWRSVLPEYERSLFDVLVESGVHEITREELAERSGRSITSSAFAAAISSLVKNGLAITSRGRVWANPDLFGGTR